MRPNLNKKTMTWAVLLAPALVGVVACGRIKDGSEDEMGTLRAAITGSAVAGVASLRFEVLPAAEACGGAAVADSVVPLAGAGDSHKLADGLFTLPAAMYRVCATPLAADGTPSPRCHQTSGVANVISSMTTEIQLVSMCDGAAAGALGATVTLNEPPYISDLRVEPGRFLLACQTARLTVTATDPEGDALDFVWTVASGPAGSRLLQAGANARFAAAAAGDYEVAVTATDPFGASVSLKVPFHVASGGDLCAGSADGGPRNEEEMEREEAPGSGSGTAGTSGAGDAPDGGPIAAAGTGGAVEPVLPVVCDPGAHQCAGAQLQQCNPGGTGWVLEQTCRSADLCAAFSGRCMACTPNKQRCIAGSYPGIATGGRVVVCSADGSAEITANSCALGCSSDGMHCKTVSIPTPTFPGF